jgi:DNA-binding MarR family transcriptional regulator
MHSMANAPTPKLTTTIDQALMLENQLCFAMYSASLAMTKVYKKMLKSLDITYPQYLVMLVLWERDEVTVSDLGSKLFLDSGTLTPLLKRMEAMQLLHRSRDAADERRVLVRLSEQGRALRLRAAAVPEKLMCALPPLEQVVNLREQLKVLRKGLLEEAGDA